MILDGYGEREADEYNAVTNANTPYLHSLREKSHSLLEASGEAVGLKPNELGGSEVGHMTIGSGRINPSTFKRIDNDMNSGKFIKNNALVTMLDRLKKNKADLHVVGMMSDKNIHSNINYTIEVIKLASSYAKNVFVHFITDGRDTPPHDSPMYLAQLEKSIEYIPNCHILSVAGRFYSMDRENNLDRNKAAIEAMFTQKDDIGEDEVGIYLNAQHKAGYNDQFIIPKHVYNENYTGLKPTDEIIFTNFREDRMVQLTKLMCNLGVNVTTMIPVGDSDTNVLYAQELVNNTLCEYLSQLGVKQVKVSESTKYAHVTYFFNGGREEPFEGEDRIHVKTRKVKDFAKTPNMRAEGITKAVIKSIKNGYEAIIVNYSNPDMVGHTGDYDATVKALEYLDKCVLQVVEAAKQYGYFVLITADHGNSDQMRTEKGEPHMAHTLSPVMCVEATKDYKMKAHGGLRDVAPTFLDLLGLEPNKYFEGQTLINHLDKKA